ncbi:MAG: tRNA lysidine(34) synthetase TilS [Candidatus Izemoplasmatales bacterium]
MIQNFGNNLIKKNDSLLLAVSGGIDSMVMLDIIYKMKGKLNLKLYIAHVDHQKRDSSKDDCDFVVDTAKELNIPYFVENLEHNDEDNFHDYAHRKRYDFFYKVAKENNINKVVLAHNANDNAETILMRLSRGSSFEGYRGILESNYYNDLLIIRPLLHVSRMDIVVYQQANLVPFQNDPTNDMDDYTRNRYRHHLLPLIAEENPRYLEKLSQFAYYQTLGYELIDDLSNTFLKEVEFNNEVTISISKFVNNHKIIQIEIIKKIINRLTNNQIELSFKNFVDIIALTTNIKPHVKFAIESAIYINKSYDNLTFSLEEIDQVNYSFTVNEYKEIKLPNGYLVSITKNANKNNGFLYKLCYNNLDLVFPLTIRNRLNGDRISTSSGTKKLKNVFIAKKIPLKERNSIPIFLNKNEEIVFIPGVFEPNTVGNNELYIEIKKG